MTSPDSDEMVSHWLPPNTRRRGRADLRATTPKYIGEEAKPSLPSIVLLLEIVAATFVVAF
jgi:hypothetical protein